MSKYTHLSGVSLINNALLNKSTAFSASERYEFNLNGLIPNRIETLEEQVQRVKIQLGRFTTDEARHVFYAIFRIQTKHCSTSSSLPIWKKRCR